MPAAVPLSLQYPVLKQLGTGSPVEHLQLSRIAEAINHCAAALHAAPVVEQGFESGQGYEFTGAEALGCRWRIPTLTKFHTSCLVLIEMESTNGDGNARLTSGVSQVSFTAAAARGWYQGTLTIDAEADFEELTLYFDGGTGALTIYSIHVSHQALASPLPAARMTQADGAYVIPVPQTADTLTQEGEPLSAGLGRLLLADLKALRDSWRRVLWSASGMEINGYLYTAHPEDFPMTLARAWHGMTEAGVKAKLHVLLEPHATKPTVFVLLINGRIAFQQQLLADATQTPTWFSADLLIPDDAYQPGHGLPSFEVGFRPLGLGAVRRSAQMTNCAVQSISLWGAI